MRACRARCSGVSATGHHPRSRSVDGEFGRARSSCVPPGRSGSRFDASSDRLVSTSWGSVRTGAGLASDAVLGSTAMTDHLRAAETAFMRRAREDPVSVGHSVAFYAGGVGSARWPVGYQDALGQAYRDDWLTIPQVLQWVAVNDYVDAGRVGVVRLELGSPPGSDKQRQENAEVLRGLPEPFVADLDLVQHGGDEDGRLEWSEEIGCFTGGGAGEAREVPVPGGLSVPLEVGACLPSRVRLHLRMSGAVARWPYHSDDVYVLVGLPTPLAFSAALAKEFAEEIRLSWNRPERNRGLTAGGMTRRPGA